jgi:hypothetical protein
MSEPKNPLFQPKSYAVTRGAAKFPAYQNLIDRHIRGDWGDCCKMDASMQNESLANGGGQQLLSVFNATGDRPTLWVITEHDLSVCTALLPEEY